MSLWGADSERRFFSDSHWRNPVAWNKEAEVSGKRRRVFCASMSDVFENRRDLDSWRARLWPLIESTPYLDWLLLTKRPQHIHRLAPWKGDWPRNIWLGTTAETQKWANERIPRLLENGAAVHFTSCEPLLGAIDLSRWLGTTERENYRLNWVIAGGESGAKSRPMNPQWVTDIRDQCNEAGVPFHFKQWGHWGPVRQAPIHAKTVSFEDRSGKMHVLARLGKHATGRRLEGTTWDGFPRAAV